MTLPAKLGGPGLDLPYNGNVSAAEGWTLQHRAVDGAGFRHRDGLVVIVSGQTELDGRVWLHVSCSRRDRVPTWSELRMVKDLFIGRQNLAIQVLPPESRHVNIHPFCLHLWHCLDGDHLPDFTRGTGSI